MLEAWHEDDGVGVATCDTRGTTAAREEALMTRRQHGDREVAGELPRPIERRISKLTAHPKAYLTPMNKQDPFIDCLPPFKPLFARATITKHAFI